MIGPVVDKTSGFRPCIIVLAFVAKTSADALGSPLPCLCHVYRTATRERPLFCSASQNGPGLPPTSPANLNKYNHG